MSIIIKDIEKLNILLSHIQDCINGRVVNSKVTTEALTKHRTSYQHAMDNITWGDIVRSPYADVIEASVTQVLDKYFTDSYYTLNRPAMPILKETLILGKVIDITPILRRTPKILILGHPSIAAGSLLLQLNSTIDTILQHEVIDHVLGTMYIDSAKLERSLHNIKVCLRVLKEHDIIFTLDGKEIE